MRSTTDTRATPRRLLALALALVLAGSGGIALAQDAPDGLAPGQFQWLPAAALGSGTPVTVVVNLRDQRATVYRDGQPIAISTVSTGRPGHETPAGVFPILGKEKMHRSNLYDDAKMPWMQRLTWDGVALHAGHVPDHPASHGCVRLPAAFAEQLYQLTQRGDTVVISEDDSLESLLRAGVDSQLASVIEAARSVHAIAGAVLADEGETAPTDGGAAPSRAF